MATALAIVQAVCKREGIPVPTALFTNDPQVDQLTEFLNELGEDLAQRFHWQVCVRRTAWVSIAGEDQGSVKSLFGADLENIVSGTIWDATQQKPLFGPLDEPRWQMEKTVATGPLYEYRIENDRLLILPAFPSGHNMSAIWRTKFWLINGSTGKSQITADTDVVRFDEDMMKVGLRVKWREFKGFTYAELQRVFEVMAANKAGKDATAPILYAAGTARSIRPGIWVPAGNWPVT